MTIDFRAMTQTLRKKAFNAVLNCIPDEDEKKEVKAIMKGNKTDNIMQLLYLKDSYIPDIKLLEQATVGITPNPIQMTERAGDRMTAPEVRAPLYCGAENKSQVVDSLLWE